MALVGYEVSIGSRRATSAPGNCDLQLVSLGCERSMDGVGGQCAIQLAGPLPEPPAVGDPVQVELDGGDGATRVFTGEIDTVSTSHIATRIVALDGLAKLARLEVEIAYEEVDAGFIVNDVLGQAGLQAGTVDTGPSFPAYVLHRGSRALGHLRRLAELCGKNLYTDADGAVHFTAPQDGAADHTFSYGETVLAVSFDVRQLGYDGVEVWGEGAASTQGAEKAHWLVTDLAGVRGQASIDASGAVAGGSAGNNPLRVRSGAVRSGDAAQTLAEAWGKALAARRRHGHLDVLGAPAVQLGHRIAIAELPREHWGELAQETASLPVRRVRHTLDLQRGFLTRIEF